MGEENEHQKKQSEMATPHGDKPLGDMNEEELLAAIEETELTEEDAEALSAETTTGEGFANPLEALAAENTRQEAQIAELNDKLLRMAAEMENLRRRTQKDVADARNFSISGFARDILGVADNLGRALDAVDDAHQEQPGVKTLVEGVEMTERELLNALEKNGVKPINPENEKFDPNFHQAMFEVPNDTVPNNTVVQVVQIGFVIGERVLRPAMVGVSKGGPKS